MWWDKVDSKFLGWDEARFRAAGFRAVPGAVVRRSAFIAKGAVLMPSFVNVGARVGEGTMIDTWATVGSCAQVGAHCHISGGAGLGGVLEPLQAAPTIIEDNCFIGARAEVAEGVIVGEGSVLSHGGLSVRLHQDRGPRHGRGASGQGAALFGGGVGFAAVGEWPQSLLRGDRQTGGREDPRQNFHQRIVARLMAIASIDALALAQDLIRRPSVTPEDAGALDLLEAVVKELGFVTAIACPSRAMSDNLYARLGDGAPHFCFAGHTDVVPAGEGWKHRSLCRRGA